MERNFRTLKERWLYGLDVSQIQSLEEFNRLLSDYIRQHNTTKHGGTGECPLERYMASNGRIRRPKSREWLGEAFHNRVVRNVNRDATVHLLNECYGGQHFPLRLTDRVANGRTKRQTALAIDHAKEGQDDVH